MKPKPTTEKYPFDARFERTLCAALFAIPSIWRTLGPYLRPKAMPSRHGELAIKLAILATGDGSHPGGITMAYQCAENVAVIGGKEAAEMQSLMTWLELGFDEVELGQVAADAIIRIGVDVLRRYETDAAASEVIADWGNRKDPEKALEAFARAKAIGGVADRGSQVLSVQGRLDTLFRANTVAVMPMGIPELDAAMDGGLAIGNVGLIVGGSGDGKSTALFETCAYTAGRLKRPSAIASCELRDRQSVLKFEAGLWGIPINEIKKNPQIIKDRYDQRGNEVAPFFFRHWDLQGSKPTIGEVFNWVDRTQDASGKKIEVLGIDHFDRFDPSKGAKMSDYAKGEAVYDEIATGAHDRQMAVWVPSQAVRKKSSALWGPGDMAHSHHKEKRADACYSVNAGGKPGNRTMTVFLYKNREGEANVIVGARPVGFAYGRLFNDSAILDQQNPVYEGLGI